MKFLRTLVLVLFLVMNLSSVAFAQADEGTVLPGTEKDLTECEWIMRYVNVATWQRTKIDVGDAPEADYGHSPIRWIVANRHTISAGEVTGVDGEVTYTDILACAIVTGDVKMWMIPFYIRFLLEFVIGIAGLIAVGGIVYGGYLYLFGGVSEDKDKGKGAIKNAVIGLVLTLLAWAIVNIVMSLVTS